MNERKTLSGFQQLRKCVHLGLNQHSVVDFFNVLTGPQLLYPPTVALSMLIKQMLDEDGSCQRAVNGWAAQRVAEGLRPHSVDTGAYCRARQRLPVEMVRALMRETGKLLCAQANTGWPWRGRTVKLVDGTGLDASSHVHASEGPNPILG